MTDIVEKMLARLIHESDQSPEKIEEFLKNILETGVVEIGGEQFPISIAHLVLNSDTAREEYDRMMLEREKVINYKEEKRSSRFQPKDIHLKNIEKMKERPLWKIQCPEHGETQAKHLTKSGFRAACGCFASLEVFYERTGFTWYGENDKSTLQRNI